MFWVGNVLKKLKKFEKIWCDFKKSASNFEKSLEKFGTFGQKFTLFLPKRGFKGAEFQRRKVG